MSRRKPARTAQIEWPAAALLALAVAFVISKAGRDSLYFREGGLVDLPWAYLGVAALSIPISALTLGAVRRLGAQCTACYAPWVLALIQLIYWPLLSPGGGWLMTLFFMLIPLSYGVLFALAWLHASEMADHLGRQQRSYVYGVLGAMPMLGGILGALAAKLPVAQADPRWLIAASSVVLASAGLLILGGQNAARRHHGIICQPCAATAKSAGQMPLGGEIRSVWRRQLVRRLTAVAMAATAAGVLVEFQFYAAAASSADNQIELSDIFANFYLALSATALAVQVLITPALQRRAGVGGNLMVLPTVLFTGAATLALSASGLFRVLLRVTEGGLKSSIHRSSWEQVYLPLPRRARRTAKVLIDALAVHAAEGATAVFLLAGFAWSADTPGSADWNDSWIIYALLVGAAVWFALTMDLRGRLAQLLPRPGDCPDDTLAPLPDSCAATAVLGDEIRREASGAQSAEGDATSGQ